MNTVDMLLDDLTDGARTKLLSALMELDCLRDDTGLRLDIRWRLVECDHPASREAEIVDDGDFWVHVK